MVTIRGGRVERLLEQSKVSGGEIRCGCYNEGECGYEGYDMGIELGH